MVEVATYWWHEGLKGGRRRVGRGNCSWGDRGAIGYLERGKIGGD